MQRRIHADREPQEKKAERGENTATNEAASLRRDSGCAAASLGFAMVDTKAKYWRLSKWNDRPKSKAVVKTIVKNFHDDGCHYKRPSNAVPIIVRRTDIDLKSLVGPTKVPDDLQTVRWLVPPVVVDIANGQHRFDASLTFQEEIQNDLVAANKQVAALERNPTTDEELQVAIAYRDQKKQYSSSLGEWIGQFYDLGESTSVRKSLANIDLQFASLRYVDS